MKMLILPFIVCSITVMPLPCLSSVEERSFLDDKFLGLYRAFRLTSRQQIGRSLEQKNSFKILQNNNRLQPQMPLSAPFPCALSDARSATRPSSVHKLRPGDIDVVGAIGDSLTAGFGLGATNILEVFYEERGKSFSIGGQDTWRRYLTLPNILKEFNRNLIGYSLGPSVSIQRDSQFNVAEGGAISQNTPYMSKVLIKRMKADKRVNLKEDWKMITYLIGDNDFCTELCYYDNYEIPLERHRQDLIEVLRLLRDNLPRTIVNIVPPIHLSVLFDMKPKPPLCEFLHPGLCPCMMGSAFRHKRYALFEAMTRWQNIDLEVANLPEFDLDEFTVVAQPFTVNHTILSMVPGRKFDFSLISEDCFHLSQKGNAQVANELWNNILEPVGHKSTSEGGVFAKFNCPSEGEPYIFTKRNS